MKRHIAVLFMVLAMGVMASAATLTVPTDNYPTITAALEAANPGDTISVTSGYTGAGEKFPILVQKDGITIQADGEVTIGGEDSHAAFVVGAYRAFNEQAREYEYVTVSDVTIQGFTIAGTADIGIVVKHATNVKITGNTIAPIRDNNVYRVVLEGIRLVEVSNSYITGNTVRRMGVNQGTPADPWWDGIGINVERSTGNTLSGNTVTESGLGLFMFDSSGNTVDGDRYAENYFGGAVLNDTELNTLTNLTVEDNEGWGVRFVNADEDTLRNSVVIYNLGGGVQLIASDDCVVDGNLVASNGDPDALDTVQIAVVPGDKADFESPVIDALNTLRDPDGDLITKPMDDFVLEKHQIEEKLDLLEWWLHDLNDELKNIEQRFLTGTQTESAIRELEGILRGDDLDGNPITRKDVFGDDPKVDLVHGMGDSRYNFTYWDVAEDGTYDPNDLNQHPFDEYWDLLSVAKLDFYSHKFRYPGTLDGYLQTESDLYEAGLYSFGLERGEEDRVYDYRWTEDDKLTWDKIGIIRTLLEAIKFELENEWKGFGWDHEHGIIFAADDEWIDDVTHLDSLVEKLDHWYYDLGLITGDTYDDLRDKIQVVQNLNDRLIKLLVGDKEAEDSNSIAGKLKEAKKEAKGAVLGEDDPVEAANHIRDAIDGINEIKNKMFEEIEHMRHKLALLDLELAPLPNINSDLVGKKEKPFDAISLAEITDVINGILGLNDADVPDGTGVPPEIIGALTNIYTTLSNRGFFPEGYVDAVVADPLGRTHSRRNVISSNIITSDLAVEADNIGIVLASPENIVVNNLLTNEGLPELDEYLHITVGDTPVYERIYRLDIGLLLLANDCFIVNNAFEFLDWGIVRGGSWDWEDYQLEYVFTKLATVAYWPGPGEVLELDRYPDERLEPGDKYYPPTVDVGYLPVLRLQAGDDPVEVNINDRAVVGNRISLNFFDHGGVGIDIIKAHSNIIDENLFFEVATANIRFGSNSDGAGVDLRHNDHYGGVAVRAESQIQADARRDYTPAEGQPGHSPVSGDVIPPAADEPFMYDNFLTIDKYETLEGRVQSRLGKTVDLQKYQYEGLPPNEGFFGLSITLFDEKPRHPDYIIEYYRAEPPKPVTERTFGPGIHMVSVPGVPEDASPKSVFAEAVVEDMLVIREYEDGQYVVPSEVDPGRGYWIYFFDEVTIQVPRELPDGEYTVALAGDGWHQISTPKWMVGWQSVSFRYGDEEKSLAQAVEAGWIEPYAFRYSLDAEDYVAVELPTTKGGIDPWTAYFLKTRVPGLTMVLPLDEPHFPGAPETVLSMSEVPTGLRPPTAPSLSSLSAELLTAVSYPSPVTGNQATFRVTGLPVQELRVSVMDLGGRNVWKAESAGNQLSWDLTNNAGRTVANGVYLYYVEAKVGGQWVTTGADRMLIVR